MLVAFGGLIAYAGIGARAVGAQGTATRAEVQIERPVAFDAAKRVMVMTPTLAARLKLQAPVWPLGGDWTEARLFALDTTTSSPVVLVAQRVDGAVARYLFSPEEKTQLLALVGAALIAHNALDDNARGSTSLVVSEPAGNAFVRNQTALGLMAYGPATAAILSESSAAAAGGGYLVAAGTSFFIAAQMTRSHSITRAQTILAFHGGSRGAGIGLTVADIADADGGAGHGIPILAGAIGGTIAGFTASRGMSDGEAAASGYAADMLALTTVGVSGAFGAFEPRPDIMMNGYPYPDNRPRSSRRVALGAAVGATLAGYVIGPRYARKSAYNVTAGDVDVAFSSALLGGIFANTFISERPSPGARFGITTGGLLLGALAADLTKVRHADRSASDGTLIQLGAFAGALMGGGMSVMIESSGQVAAALVGLGGMAGLALTDAVVRPGPDAGPKRGISSNTGNTGTYNSSRVSLSVVPAATALLLQSQRRADARIPVTERPTVQQVPVMRIAF
jgi:hypothetical protein